MTVFYAAVHDPLLVFQKYDLPFYRKLILSHVCISGCERAALVAVGCVYVCTFLPVHEALHVCMHCTCTYVCVCGCLHMLCMCGCARVCKGPIFKSCQGL